jgi:hypothetical protein
MKNNWLIYLIFVLSILFVLLPVSPLFQPYPTEDSGMFMYEGRNILMGNLPYRDIWEHKGPIILYINALGLGLFRNSAWGVWLMQFLFTIVAAILGFLVMTKVFNKLSAFFAILLWIGSLVLLLNGGNTPELYNLLLQFAIIYLFWKSQQQNKYYRTEFIIGLLGGISFLLKQNLIGIFLSVLIYITIKRVINRQIKSLLSDLFVMLIGFLLPLIISAGYFYNHGTLDKFIDSVYRFNLVYVNGSLIARIKVVFMGLWILGRSGMTFIATTAWISCIIFFIKDHRHKLINYFIILAIIDYPFELILASASGIHPPQYFICWLPVFSILSGWLINFFTMNKINGIKIIISILLFSMLLFPLGIAVYQYFPQSDKQICKDLNWFLLPGAKYFECTDTKRKVTEFVTENTKKEDYVLLWGFGGSINFTANRLSPTRFVYQYPLFLSGYTNDWLINEFYQQLVKNKPEYIIDTETYAHVPSLDKKNRNKWNHGKVKKQVDKIFNFIDSNYQYQGTIGDDQWKIYKLANK